MIGERNFPASPDLLHYRSVTAQSLKRIEWHFRRNYGNRNDRLYEHLRVVMYYSGTITSHGRSEASNPDYDVTLMYLIRCGLGFVTWSFDELGAHSR